jgi:hypothetical protein
MVVTFAGQGIKDGSRGPSSATVTQLKKTAATAVHRIRMGLECDLGIGYLEENSRGAFGEQIRLQSGLPNKLQ